MHTHFLASFLLARAFSNWKTARVFQRYLMWNRQLRHIHAQSEMKFGLAEIRVINLWYIFWITSSVLIRVSETVGIANDQYNHVENWNMLYLTTDSVLHDCITLYWSFVNQILICEAWSSVHIYMYEINNKINMMYKAYCMETNYWYGKQYLMRWKRFAINIPIGVANCRKSLQFLYF